MPVTLINLEYAVHAFTRNGKAESCFEKFGEVIFQANFRQFEPLCVASAAPSMAAENIMDLIGHFTQWSKTNNADTFWLN